MHGMQQCDHEKRRGMLYLRTSGARSDEILLAPQEGKQAAPAGDAVEQSSIRGFARSHTVFVRFAQHHVGVLWRDARRPFIRGQNRIGSNRDETAASVAPNNGYAPPLLDLCVSRLTAESEIPIYEPADRKQIPSYIGCGAPAR